MSCDHRRTEDNREGKRETSSSEEENQKKHGGEEERESSQEDSDEKGAEASVDKATGRQESTGEEIFEVFCKTVNHDYMREWKTINKRTICICIIDKGEPLIFENEGKGGSHAEIVMLQHLESLPSGERSIKLYSNYSPCSRCGTHILEYLSNHKNTSFEMIFAAFYRINRPSCNGRSCACHGFNNCNATGESERGKEVLKKMGRHVVRPFMASDRDDWEDLIRILQNLDKKNESSSEEWKGKDYYISRRGDDSDMLDDFDKLVPPQR